VFEGQAGVFCVVVEVEVEVLLVPPMFVTGVSSKADGRDVEVVGAFPGIILPDVEDRTFFAIVLP
jgi:hypothetical protein